MFRLCLEERPVHSVGNVPFSEIGSEPSSRGFVAMLSAFRSTGGTARGDDVAQLLQEHDRGDCASLARLIVARQVFVVDWRQTLWVPMFQFDSGDLSIRQGIREILVELAPEFHGWTVAAWFAMPNARLDDTCPADLIQRQADLVLEAARADRFVFRKTIQH